jgi:hypothetical protein
MNGSLQCNPGLLYPLHEGYGTLSTMRPFTEKAETLPFKERTRTGERVNDPMDSFTNLTTY